MLKREDLRQAEQIFKQYISSYDIHDGMIYTKVKHSYKVEQNSLRLAKELGLSEEEVVLQGIIGLFHDIGRFEQARIYHNFRDYETVDHADFGVQILQQEHLLDALLSKEDLELTYLAITNHNKLHVQDGLNDREMLHTELIRDADKIDILRLRAEHDEDEGLGIFKEELEADSVSDYAYETFMSHHSIDTTKRKTRLDGVVTICGFIFDLNVNISKKIIDENDYISRIITWYDFQEEQTRNRMMDILNEANRYLKE